MTLGSRRRRRRRRLAITSPGVIVIDPRRDPNSRRRSRWGNVASPAGMALASLGALHVVRPRWFAGAVGVAFPTNRRVWTTAVGAAEMALGAAVYVPRTRTAGVIGAAVFVGVMAGRASRRSRAEHRRDEMPVLVTPDEADADPVSAAGEKRRYIPPMVAPSEN